MTTPGDQDLENALATALRDAIVEPFGGSVCVHIDEGELFFVDGRNNPVEVRKAAPSDSADCQVYGSKDVFMRILRGERGIENAFVSGRIRLDGDMSVFARLAIKEKR